MRQSRITYQHQHQSISLPGSRWEPGEKTYLLQFVTVHDLHDRMHDLKLKLNVLAKFLSGFSKKEYYCQKGWSGTKHQHQRPCGG